MKFDTILYHQSQTNPIYYLTLHMFIFYMHHLDNITSYVLTTKTTDLKVNKLVFFHFLWGVQSKKLHIQPELLKCECVCMCITYERLVTGDFYHWLSDCAPSIPALWKACLHLNIVTDCRRGVINWLIFLYVLLWRHRVLFYFNCIKSAPGDWQDCSNFKVN